MRRNKFFSQLTPNTCRYVKTTFAKVITYMLLAIRLGNTIMRKRSVIIDRTLRFSLTYVVFVTKLP